MTMTAYGRIVMKRINPNSRIKIATTSGPRRHGFLAKKYATGNVTVPLTYGLHLVADTLTQEDADGVRDHEP